MSDYGLPPSELDGIIKQCSFTEQLSQLELNGNGAKFQSRKEETPPNFVAGWLKWWMEIRLVYKNVVKLAEFHLLEGKLTYSSYLDCCGHFGMRILQFNLVH
ncbi:unnamed protein product [Camellia sinensis]